MFFFLVPENWRLVKWGPVREDGVERERWIELDIRGQPPTQTHRDNDDNIVGK